MIYNTGPQIARVFQEKFLSEILSGTLMDLSIPRKALKLLRTGAIPHEEQ